MPERFSSRMAPQKNTSEWCLTTLSLLLAVAGPRSRSVAYVKVRAALHPIGFSLLDHIIVAGAGIFSLAEAGLMVQLNLECLASGNNQGIK